ncbi:hypothetical protein NQ317_007560 [Molorchus minor]|uniref:Nose resistant-to-fluoxetine protein N-terminal domain-containing protein n=1 Tax=Molorchus minor TaxID=1323400 RepID=A0ABQ9K796_9CUCU|nr:hypothetical protein NQ317_007560 [Molorchus minor]
MLTLETLSQKVAIRRLLQFQADSPTELSQNEASNIFFLLLGLAVSVKTEIRDIDVVYFEDYNVPRIDFICYNLTVGNVSEKCGEQLDFACQNGLFTTMLDATSKFPYPGVGYSSRWDFGNFDQCMSVDQEYVGGRILGEFCSIGLVIPDITNVSDTNLYFRLSVCRPDGCSADDYNAILRPYLNQSLFQDGMCRTKETGIKLGVYDYITISIIAIVVLLMLFSTVYDIYLYQSQWKPFHPLLLAFSVLTNGRKLLHVGKNTKEQINTFHGLKVISMMWIVAGHAFVGWQSVPVTNLDVANSWLKQRYAGYITTAPLAVDTFFFISGFLLAFQYLKQKPKPLLAQVASVPHMILHRYLRLTPALLVMYLTGISIFRHFGNGPLWDLTTSLATTCKKYWWSFFLYIQNYYNYDDICFTQTWYVSADMQMFVLAPFILIPISLQLKYKSGFHLAMLELICINLFCIALPIAIKLVYQDYANNYDTHSRLINYFAGVMLAVFMRVKHDKRYLYTIDSKHIPLANYLIWIIMILGMLTTVICYQEVEMNHGYESKSIFYSLMRPAWCMGLSWIVYSCYHGYGGIINWILCRPIYQVMGRLTYCMYLMHGLVIAYYVLTTRDKWHFTDYNAFYYFCGHYIVTTIFSIFWTLAFESPLIIIEKYLLGGGGKRKQVKPPEINGNVEAGPSN